MNEELLHYIWQTQSFSKTDLRTTDDEKVDIYDPGELNRGSGPDFSESRLVIDGMAWSGDVEIHALASYWNSHRHNVDSNYDKVILHVVWEEDKKVQRSDGSYIPTVELKDYMPEDWLSRYDYLMNSLQAVPCETYLANIDEIIIADAVNNALISRLEAKSAQVLSILDEFEGDWEKTAITWLFIGFGFKKNKEAFAELARRVDLGILRKLPSLMSMEAYLFGLSGLIPNSNDEYVQKLRQEYEWLDKKYGIKNYEMSMTWWQFKSMRPASFPTRRIAQLAALLFEQRAVLRTILESEPGALVSLFKSDQSSFWEEHYHFNAKTAKKVSGMGAESQNSLLINVVAVLLVAYGKAINQPGYIEKAVQVLESIKSEANNITRLWRDLGVKSGNASDSQGLIELFNNYCKKSRCLSCSIGRHILQAK